MTQMFSPDLKELAQRCDLIRKSGQSEIATHEKLDLFAGILITQYHHYLNQLNSKESKQMTHPHAHILQAIIDGKEVQYTLNNVFWRDIAKSDNASNSLLKGNASGYYKFRIKPATVTINGVELEDDRIYEGYGYIESVISSNFYECTQCAQTNTEAIQRGIAHRTKEGAIAFCKARLGIKD